MASDPHGGEPLTRALRSLVEWLRGESVPAVVIGGIAVSAIGRPRTTKDIDALVLVDEDGWPSFLESARRQGFQERLSDALAFAKRSRVLLLVHRETGIEIDVSFGALPFEHEVVARSRVCEALGVNVPLPTPEDLIVLKAVAHRAQDMADIQSVLDAQPTIDLKRVRGWVRQFAEVLETPELLDDLERLLEGRRRSPKKRRR
jgi:predicted nucleotidyltransferase